MLPSKLKLSKELAGKLREIRLNNPVNGEILTAENLSKSIGNNRAWMSQIESRRLKNIKREDIIKIYRLLFNIDSSDRAEEKAELDLLKYLKDSSSHNMFFSYKPHFEENETNLYSAQPFNNSDKLIDKATMKKVCSDFTKQCKNITLNLSDYFNTLSDNEKILANFYISRLNRNIIDDPTNSLKIIASLPLANYQYASAEGKNILDKKINDLQCELEKLDFDKYVSIYNDNVSYYLNLFDQHKYNSIAESNLSNLFYQLINLLNKYDSKLNGKEKIQYINNYIRIINLYSLKANNALNISELTINSNIDVIKSTLDYIQIYLNGLDSNNYFLNKISDLL